MGRRADPQPSLWDTLPEPRPAPAPRPALPVAPPWTGPPVCGCADLGRGSGFTLDPGSGWWVHAVCRRPTRAWLLGSGALTRP